MKLDKLKFSKKISKLQEGFSERIDNAVFALGLGGAIWVVLRYRLESVTNIVNADPTIKVWIVILGVFGIINLLQYQKVMKLLINSQTVPTQEETQRNLNKTDKK